MSIYQDPFVACADAEMKAALHAALVTLTERQQEVLQLYYHTGLTMKEIGAQLGLTESGVCRVHSGALRHLRIELKRIEDGGARVTRPKNLRKMQVSQLNAVLVEKFVPANGCHFTIDLRPPGCLD